jgi:NAD(P)-dependent dehydrogenase (short-subunit alcohol dehydrogenase family)
MPALVVLGARNLGGAILGHHLNNGWRGAAVARSPETLETVRAAGGLPIAADASDPESLREALERARSEFGRLDLIVNAVSAARPTRPGPFGGGPLGEASVEDFRGWTGAVAEQAFVFLSEGVRAGASTLIQVTGGSARRAMPGRGLWAAGAAATRALVHAAAQELRAEGVHVALLVVDATIDSPKTAAMLAGRPENESADMADIARAVEYLAGQSPRAFTHELVVTPAGDRWVP